MSLTVSGIVCLIFSDKIYVAFVLPDYLFNVNGRRKLLTFCVLFSRFEEIHEDIEDEDDDDIHAITQPGTIAIMDNDIGDQQEILEV